MESRTDPQTSLATIELLYNISREIASALDLRTVLQRVLYLSIKHVGAINGSMIVLNEEKHPIESAIIIGSRTIEAVTHQLRATIEEGLAGWVIRNQQAVLVTNTAQDERWLSRPDDAPDRTGAKSAICVPLFASGQLVGVITLVHSTPEFFTLEHLNLIQAIADQAGVAILNARLYAESERQARVMTALAEGATAITSTVKLEAVLRRILEQTIQALQVEVVSLALIDPTSQELVFQASSGDPEQRIIGTRLTPGQGIAGWVAKEGKGIVVPDVSVDTRFHRDVDQMLGFQTQAVACAPIRSRGKVIGVLEAINPTSGMFDPDALLVLNGIGSLAGTTIHHAQLFESLESANRRYQELFESSIDPILISDKKGQILETNRPAEYITGASDVEITSSNVQEMGIVNQSLVGSDFSLLSYGDTITYETSLRTKKGIEIPIQVYVQEVIIENVSHLQWTLRDITERKNLENLRNDLVSMIYHDLRSPLANIISSLDVLKSLALGEEDQTHKTLLEIAIRSTERIQRLTDSLLDIRRLESGQPIANRQPTSITELIQSATQIVLPIVQGKHQEIKMLLREDLPDVWVDEDMIKRLLTNLLENAVKYTPTGSKIIVGVKPESDKIIVWVQDTGPGIPPEDRERVFDKYTRLHGKGGMKGLGLGLAFCKLAIEAHGGQIWVEDAPGTGAIFKFTLPVWKAEFNHPDGKAWAK